jgi:hypothetical protein
MTAGIRVSHAAGRTRAETIHARVLDNEPSDILSRRGTLGARDTAQKVIAR